MRECARSLARSALHSLVRLLPAPRLTDAERVARVHAEADTLNERVWLSMRSESVS